MILHLVGLAVLALLYCLAWRPAKDPIPVQLPKAKRNK